MHSEGIHTGTTFHLPNTRNIGEMVASSQKRNGNNGRQQLNYLKIHVIRSYVLMHLLCLLAGFVCGKTKAWSS